MAGDLNVLVWIAESGWEACVDAAAALPAETVTLLHVTHEEEHHGLLGRRHREDLVVRMAAVAGEAADALLEDAADRLGRAAHRVAATGRAETIVMEAALNADVLVLAREGRRPGPRSIGHAARYVVDHAPCTVVLAWPEGAPDAAHAAGPPPPHGEPPPPAGAPPHGGPPPAEAPPHGHPPPPPPPHERPR